MIKQTNKQKPHPISRLHSSLGQGVSLTSNQKKKKKKTWQFGQLPGQVAHAFNSGPGEADF